MDQFHIGCRPQGAPSCAGNAAEHEQTVVVTEFIGSYKMHERLAATEACRRASWWRKRFFQIRRVSTNFQDVRAKCKRCRRQGACAKCQEAQTCMALLRSIQ